MVESSGFGVADSGVVRASTHSLTPLDAAEGPQVEPKPNPESLLSKPETKH